MTLDLSPSDVGLPKKFERWRRGQLQAVESLLDSSARFNGLVAPVGSGKSGMYMAYTGVDDGRACILTYDRVLQDQLLRDGFDGLIDMRGRQNYICDIDRRKSAAEAICTAGVYCQNMKTGPCQYFDQKREAGQARRVVSNYSFWLHDEEIESLGRFDTLILDEAHKAPDAISEYAAVEMTGSDFDRYRIPRPGRNKIQNWGPKAIQRMEDIARIERGSGDHDRIRKVKDVQRKLARLCRLSEQEWVLDHHVGRKGAEWYRWDLIDPSALAETLLFRGAKKVIMVSASIRRKTFKLLGVSDKIQIIEQDSSFPVKTRPIYYWPVAKMRYGMPDEELDRSYRAIDQLIERRQDRKGLIHSVSYDRAREIFFHSFFRDSGHLICDHDKNVPAEEVLARFRMADAPAVLISPRFSTGVDFPGDECEYAIIPKVPWPVFNAPLIAARTRRDAEYPAYATAQTVQQSVGRHHRRVEDWSETFILDSTFGRLRGQYRDFFARWFTSAIRTLKAGERPPDPPPRQQQ